MVRWKGLAPAAPFGGVAVLYVLYRLVSNTAGIEAVDLSVPLEAWQSLAGPQEAVASLGARLTWGIAVLAFDLAFLAALRVLLSPGGEEGEPAQKPLEEGRLAAGP